MPLIPLDIPPGVHANGTDFDSSGRWRSASLVRWRNGLIRPVGGWQERVASDNANPPRGMLAWEDNSGDRWMATGDADALKVTSAAGITYDITPVGLTAGDVDATVNTGYGGGLYGADLYGTPRPDTGNYGEATTWALDTWGEYLVACSNADGKLYEWQLNTSAPAAAISGAPTANRSLMVTEERFLFALGAGGSPRKVQWSDKEDNTTWTAAATNEAGDILLQTSGQIMAGLRARGNALILTDVDAHSATYVGPPFVYGFERVGTSCGLIARKAAASTDAGVFWMGPQGFFRFDGQTVKELPCEVLDHVFGDLSQSQVSKTWAMNIGRHNEVWWFYPSGASTEIDRYVVFNYAEGYWSMGELSRTAGADSGVFRYPLMTTVGGSIYNHEYANNYEGASVFAETGPISLGAGDQVMKVTQLIPDEANQGDVTATFKTRFHPNDTERSYGPYTMANPTDVRFTGRQVRMRIDGSVLTEWKVGTMRINAVGGGRR
jgi:hypothetical protein